MNVSWEKAVMFAKAGRVTFTDLVIGDQRNTMVDSQPANEEVILQVASVVIGQVYHQVNMTLADQSNKRCKKKTVRDYVTRVLNRSYDIH